MYSRPKDDIYYEPTCGRALRLKLFGKYRWLTLTAYSLVLIGFGFAAGYFTRVAITPPAAASTPTDYDPKIVATLQSFIIRTDIATRLTEITQQIHLAGTNANRQVASYLSNHTISSGLRLRVLQYDGVLLQYPLAAQPNTVEQLADGEPHFVTQNNGSYFNAYSANGSYIGKPLFVNYGTYWDFENLTSLVPCSEVENERLVAIAKYGHIFRGTIALNAANWNPCSPEKNITAPIGALLLYLDPADYARNSSKIWPNGTYVRPTDVAVGTVKDVFTMPGDPLTPGLPSVDGVYREEVASRPLLKLLVQPISYADAGTLMRNMTGSLVESWVGGLNVSYKIGPGYDGEQANWTLRVNVAVNETANRQSLQNIVTVVRGAVEPDRYVIVGAHYDAWTNGANDAGGATSILSTLVSALGKLAKQGWRPRRTIICINWDAEEYGLIGSQEFIDQFGAEIDKRTVVYLNSDTAVNGLYTFTTKGHPLLATAIYNATRIVQFPNDTASRSVYDVWRNRTQAGVNDLPSVEPTGSGSDQWSFWNRYGVPYAYPQFKENGRSGVPFYHTLLDTYDTVEHLVDPGFVFHEVMCKILADIVLRFSDSAVIPYSFDHFAASLTHYFDKLVNQNGQLFDEATREYANTTKASLELFHQAASNFTKSVMDLTPASLTALELRSLNDRMMLVSQTFVTQYNIGYRQVPSLLYDVDSRDDYKASYFPGVLKAVRDMEAADQKQRQDGLINIKRELSALLTAFRQAASILLSQTLAD